MKNRTLMAIIAVCIVAMPNLLKAQLNESKLEMKPFGIGLHMEQFKLSDINSDFGLTPANKIILTFNRNNNFRFETELGFAMNTNSETEFEGFSVNLGLGAFRMIQKGNTNFYGGARIGITHSQTDNSYSSISGSDDRQIYTLTPTLGVEHFFGNNFSLGGEIGLKLMKAKKSITANTETGVFMRYYF